jgi:SulP family sulfate permease
MLSLPNFTAKIKTNWQSALTVALVSLPLNIALSIASGAGPIPGIITGVWAGIIAALFGGSHYNVIGTAGALSTILASFAGTKIGDSTAMLALPLLAITTGFFILLVFALKLERYLIYIPTSVMYGFAAGVAITIAMNQIRDATGLQLHKHDEFLANLWETVKNLGQAKIITLAVFGFFLSFLLIFKKFVKQIPGVIPVAILGIILGFSQTYFGWNLGLETLQQKQGNISVSLFNAPNLDLYQKILTNWDFLFWLLKISLTVSLIGILETLITAKIADKITQTKFNTRKELLGLGLANIASGVMGGLPATGVFIRTGLNIKSGANHRTSALLSAIFTGILAFVFLPFFQYIPMAVIAAILFNTAIGLIEIKEFKRYWLEDKSSFLVGILVALITVISDASIGILIGAVLALLFFVDKLSKGSFEVTFNSHKKIVRYEHGNCFVCPKESHHKIDVVVYSIEGIMAYVDGPKHLENFEKMAKMKHLETVIIRMRDLFYLDLDGRDLLEEAIDNLQKNGKKVLVTGPCQEVSEVLKLSNTFRELHDNKHIFPKTEFALFSIGFAKEDLGFHKKHDS